jgi:hypothetical protein
MPKKKIVIHPEKAHPTLTEEESRSRVLERQRDRRARRKLELNRAQHSGSLSDLGGPAVLVTQGELPSKDTSYILLIINQRERESA